MRKAAFLDRDGVLNLDKAYVHSRDEFDWVPGVFDAAKKLTDAGFILVVVTNQSGIGRGYYTKAEYEALTAWMKKEFQRAGTPLAAVYCCPHHPDKALGGYRIQCQCRKPRPGMLLQAANELDIDLSRSIMFGDKPGDATAGRAAGCPERIFLGTDGRSVPTTEAPDATRRFASLLDAVSDPWVNEFSKGK